MKEKKVVITGLGVVAPAANGVEAFAHNLMNGISGLTYVDEMKKLKFNCCVGGICEISTDTILKKFPSLQIPIISRSTLLLALSASEALNDAHLEHLMNSETTHDYDIIIGSTIGPADLWGDKIVPMVDGGRHLRLGSSAFEQIINSSPAAMLAGILGLTGRVMSGSLACASSTEAIIEAANKIKYEGKSVVIAGGVEPYSKYYWATMDAMKIINSKHNDTPQKSSRPMSATAGGFIPAEGAAVLILEELQHALDRNATIYAEIIGSHINCGGLRNGGSMTSSNKEMLTSCISKALNQANVSKDNLDLISGHLTATKSDVAEIQAWKDALDCTYDDFPLVNSVKSLIGHTLGACGAIEVIAVLLQMKENFVHPSINCEDIHPLISEIINTKCIPQKAIKNISIKTAAKANFGFGDVNTCLILKKYE